MSSKLSLLAPSILPAGGGPDAVRSLIAIVMPALAVGVVIRELRIIFRTCATSLVGNNIWAPGTGKSGTKSRAHSTGTLCSDLLLRFPVLPLDIIDFEVVGNG
jgi:hypothetical protein